MTTINFKFIIENNINPIDIIFLQACHQNTGHLDSYISSFIGKGLNVPTSLLHITKGKSIRLNKEGRDFLRKIFSPEGQTSSDEVISDYLISVYKKSEDEKILCSKAKLTKLIAWLRGILGIDSKSLLKIIEIYLTDEEASKYNKRLDYLIYKPTSAYGGAMSLSNGESRIYDYYLQNRDKIDNIILNDF